MNFKMLSFTFLKRAALFLVLSVMLILSSSCMRNVHMNTLRPAPITVPSHVQTLVIVDRTLIESQGMRILDGILSGGLPGEKQNGIQQALLGVQQRLNQSPRFHVRRASETMVGNNITGAFPEPLTWRQVDNIARQYDADAVLALELFDTKFIVTDGERVVEKYVEDENGKKKKVKVNEFYAEGVASANVGFRLYDPQDRSIIDQERFSKANTWEASASSIREAVALLMDKAEGIRYVSALAGQNYANRIAPMPTRITRQFYHKPKRNLYINRGRRLADVGQWQNAVKTWEEGIPYANKEKIAGRLAYNTAIGHEVLGDFQGAQYWAGKAWTYYGNKKARDYSRVLNRRIRNENLLDLQLSGR